MATNVTSFDFLDISIHEGLVQPGDGVMRILNTAQAKRATKEDAASGPSLISKKAYNLNQKSSMIKSNNFYTVNSGSSIKEQLVSPGRVRPVKDASKFGQLRKVRNNLPSDGLVSASPNERPLT